LWQRQLAVATKSYLESEVSEQGNALLLPAIMGWFRGDFGGRKGIRKLLRENGYPQCNASTGIRFQNYNWQLSLDKYS